MFSIPWGAVVSRIYPSAFGVGGDGGTVTPAQGETRGKLVALEYGQALVIWSKNPTGKKKKKKTEKERMKKNQKRIK